MTTPLKVLAALVVSGGLGVTAAGVLAADDAPSRDVASPARVQTARAARQPASVLRAHFALLRRPASAAGRMQRGSTTRGVNRGLARKVRISGIGVTVIPGSLGLCLETPDPLGPEYGFGGSCVSNEVALAGEAVTSNRAESGELLQAVGLVPDEVTRVVAVTRRGERRAVTRKLNTWVSKAPDAVEVEISKPDGTTTGVAIP